MALHLPPFIILTNISKVFDKFLVCRTVVTCTEQSLSHDRKTVKTKKVNVFDATLTDLLKAFDCIARDVV